MYYNIARTMTVFPYICYGILGVGLLMLEVRFFVSQLKVKPEPEPGRGGFVQPPGDGYEYYAAKGVITYILKKGSHYRVYVETGSPPNGVSLRRDRYGTYFMVRAKNTAEAERIIDQTFQR